MTRYVRPKPRTKYSGVYAIRHIDSGQMYVGGSSDITGRFAHDRFMLRRGMHKTLALQQLWSKDGEAAFEFVTLERCDQQLVREREDAWIKGYPCLNTVKAAGVDGRRGPSDAKKVAARKRWARPDYRAKREAWLARRDKGRFTSDR